MRREEGERKELLSNSIRRKNYRVLSMGGGGKGWWVVHSSLDSIIEQEKKGSHSFLLSLEAPGRTLIKRERGGERRNAYSLGFCNGRKIRGAFSPEESSRRGGKEEARGTSLPAGPVRKSFSADAPLCRERKRRYLTLDERGGNRVFFFLKS